MPPQTIARPPKAAPAKEELPVDQSKLLGLVGYNCRRAYLKIFGLFQERMAELGLKPVEYSVITLVRANPNINQKRLGHALSIEAPNMATLLDRLETRGLVVRARNPHDKRAHLLALSVKGKRLAVTAEDIASRLELDATSALNDEDRVQLMRLLQRIFLD